jgi:hypothetical protein
VGVADLCPIQLNQKKKFILNFFFKVFSLLHTSVTFQPSAHAHSIIHVLFLFHFPFLLKRKESVLQFAIFLANKKEKKNVRCIHCTFTSPSSSSVFTFEFEENEEIANYKQ